jgi:hypothetical protein
MIRARRSPWDLNFLGALRARSQDTVDKTNAKFSSNFQQMGTLRFPDWGGIRIQMMPIELGRLSAVPAFLFFWLPAIRRLFIASPVKEGIAYLTIDERFVRIGETHRRPGLHVDGMGAWGDGGAWGKAGMLMSASAPGCVAWNQEFNGSPLAGKDPGDPDEGSSEHLREQCRDDSREFLKSSAIYWCEPLCVHELLPSGVNGFRSFVRLSMPSHSPWPANCTPNPLGVQPEGKIVGPRRTTGSYAY